MSKHRCGACGNVFDTEQKYIGHDCKTTGFKPSQREHGQKTRELYNETYSNVFFSQKGRPGVPAQPEPPPPKPAAVKPSRTAQPTPPLSAVPVIGKKGFLERRRDKKGRRKE